VIQSILPPEPPAIIVTGTALPDPSAARAYDRATLGLRELRDAPSSQLDQILKSVPGVQLFRRSDARSGHPTSQGVTLRALGGNAASRALLILDGVPQSDPFGGWVNWPAYDPARLAKVRVVRGGGSVEHGAGALAGTIQMTSLVDAGVSGDMSGGSRQSLEARLSGGMPIGAGILMISGRGERGDGFVPITSDTRGPADIAAAYRSGNARMLLAAPVSGTIRMQASLAAFHDKRERGTRFTGNRTDGVDTSIRLTGDGEWRWTALGYAQWRELRSSFASVSPGRVSASRASLQDSVPSRGLGGSFEVRAPAPKGVELRFGADMRQTRGETRELYSYVAGDPTRRRIAGGRATSGGVFAETTADLRKLTLSGGGRIDRWRVEGGRLLERQIATGAVLRNDQYRDRSGWRPTARAGAVVDAGEGLSLRSAAYLGWRLPTLNELFRPFRAGADATAANPLLKPERLRGAEVGANYSRKGVTLGLTVFDNRLSDAIANVTLGSGPGVFPGVGFVGAGGQYRQRRNLDHIHVQGMEASAGYRWGAWSIDGGYSFANANVEGSGAASQLDGLRPAQTPRHMLTSTLGWERDGWSLSLTARRVGAQFEDDLNQLRLPPATTLDAFAAWPVSRRMQIILRGENLIDRRVVAGIGGDGAIERATPRTLWIGARVNR
jgi:outer membrane receptor protein involved in Fe transport